MCFSWQWERVKIRPRIISLSPLSTKVEIQEEHCVFLSKQVQINLTDDFADIHTLT